MILYYLLLPVYHNFRYKMTAHRCFLWFSVKVIYHAPFKKKINQIHQSILEKIIKTVAGAYISLNLLFQICFLKAALHNKEDNLALKDKQSVPKGRRPLIILNTNFSNKGNKFTNALGDYYRIATFFPFFFLHNVEIRTAMLVKSRQIVLKQINNLNLMPNFMKIG